MQRRKEAMTADRAIEILDPAKRVFDTDSETIQAIATARRALINISAAEHKHSEGMRPTNAEVMLSILADVVDSGADEEGYPVMDYDTLVMLMHNINCPYYNQPRCAEDARFNRKHGLPVNPDAFADCDDCKQLWLMQERED